MHDPIPIEDEVQKAIQQSLMMNTEESQLQQILNQSQLEYDEQQDTHTTIEHEMKAALAMSMQVNR